MDYEITEVKFFSKETYGRDQNHRVVVRFKNYDKDVSAFVPEKPEVGTEWVGEITKSEKNDKIYYNFKFERGEQPQKSQVSQTESSARNYLEFKIEPQLAAIYGRLGLIGAALNIKMDTSTYPKMDSTNDAHGLDTPTINLEDSPF